VFTRDVNLVVFLADDAEAECLRSPIPHHAHDSHAGECEGFGRASSGSGKGCLATWKRLLSCSIEVVATRCEVACRAKYAQSCHIFGHLLRQGFVGPKDPVRGKAFIDKGCSLGSPQACAAANQ
jgi:hypothetical protein